MSGKIYEDQKAWTKIIKKYNKPDLLKSLWQMVNSFIPYFGLWILMYYSLSISYWLTLGLSILAAGFLLRIFIIFHDCSHGSFFRSPTANRVVGIIAAGFIYTPYHKWTEDHRIHHQTAGNLDNKGVGDVRTFTVEEYKKFTPFQKTLYKIYRHPIMLFIVGPLLLFLVIFRFPPKDRSLKEKVYTHITTVVLAVAVYLMILWIGVGPFIKIQLPILFVAAGHGAWIFYVQHTYKDVRWERQENWDYATMAFEGSSYLKLPKILQWFTGNVCFHHIHHLSPLIPNYKLEKCYNENPSFHVENPLTFFSALDTLKYRLWDEERKKLISFKEMK
jgi:omega-6 fatty acid desaturase (delta-12 desaturase)